MAKKQEDNKIKDNNAEKKVAYLTFDDGPGPLTEQYLDILKKEGVTATFFLIGQQIEGEYVETVKREVREGHEVGVHTYCHEAEEIYCNADAYFTDVQKTSQRIEKVTGVVPTIYRFPWGSANAYIAPYKMELIERLRAKGLEFEDWNVSGEDCVGSPESYTILKNIRKDYKKYTQPVILLHDAACCQQTLEVLPELIQELKETGYKFDILSNRPEPCQFLCSKKDCKK